MKLLLILIFMQLSSGDKLCNSNESVYKIISTNNGNVRGRLQVTNEGDKAWHFLSIPYAKPPLHKLRFRRPIVVDDWNTTKDVFERPNSCPQGIDTGLNNFTGIHMWNANTNISEDCLYLSVYTPYNVTENSSLPVMVWIYGGGFYSGTTTLDVYDASNIVAGHDVIIVAMQYRLGPLGFLNLDIEDAPGNMGLLDQVMALRWVRKNIGKFGGDANRVTLFGESAGAASISYLLLNGTSAKLFDRAILQSGSALPAWAFHNKTTYQTYAKDFLAAVNCSFHNNSKLAIECLHNISIETIIEHYWVSTGFGVFPFVPTVDNYLISDDPHKLFATGKSHSKQLMAGINRNEGIYFVIYQDNSTFDVYKPNLEINRTVYENVLQDIFQSVLSLTNITDLSYKYGNWSMVNQTPNYIEAIDKITGDFLFACPLLKWTSENRKEYPNSTYLYLFDYRESNTPWPEWAGVMHGYEIPLVFGNPLNKTVRFNEGDKKVSSKMIKYWVNFAADGDPNGNESDIPRWNPIGNNTLEEVYLQLELNHTKNSSNLRREQCEYIEKLFTFNVSSGNIY